MYILASFVKDKVSIGAWNVYQLKKIILNAPSNFCNFLLISEVFCWIKAIFTILAFSEASGSAVGLINPFSNSEDSFFLYFLLNVLNLVQIILLLIKVVTMPKPLTVWITINCGKFWKRWEYQTTLSASWEICLQVRKQQLELDMEPQTGSK